MWIASRDVEDVSCARELCASMRLVAGIDTAHGSKFNARRPYRCHRAVDSTITMCIGNDISSVVRVTRTSMLGSHRRDWKTSEKA